MFSRHALDWKVGFTSAFTGTPDEMVPAKVPGAVQLDWANAHDWQPYWKADNFKQYDWMEDVYWLYSAQLKRPALTNGERLHFYCGGIDYRFEIRLDGVTLLRQEGMFTPVDLDITERAVDGSRIEVLVYPAPKMHASPVDRSQAAQSCKPAVSYGWDWHPRLIPLGIWCETYLEVRPAVHLVNVSTAYTLSEDLSQAHLEIEAHLNASAVGSVTFTLGDPDGKDVFARTVSIECPTVSLAERIDSPCLWWSHDHGEQARYLLKTTVRTENGGVSETTQHIGFRRVRLVMHEGAWNAPAGFPKTRSTPPITLELNGRRIFAKGTNWVNPEIFPGIMSEETYRPLLELARGAHFNLLRIWGGGIVNKPSFFDLCDQMGIMVWQEFPLACNDYIGTTEYLAVLDQESRSIIKQLRGHPSLALWCGGNELFNAWSGMTDQSKALRLLNKNCYELDQNTPYLPTSPVMGMAHGDYRFRDETGREVYGIFGDAAGTAYTEFGCPGPSSRAALESFMPTEDLFPPKRGTPWETHHGLGAWEMDPGTWLCQSTIEHYFGPTQTLDELIERGQWLQCEGYKAIYEEARRQKPVCSMSLNWCYNEPWPAAANNSLIEWPSTPKPAYYAVTASCRPVLASARLPKFSWREGEDFTAELWLLNDAYATIPKGEIVVSITANGSETHLLTWHSGEAQPNRNLRGPGVRFRLPHYDSDRITLRVTVAGNPDWNSEYVLHYRARDQKNTQPAKRILNV